MKVNTETRRMIDNYTTYARTHTSIYVKERNGKGRKKKRVLTIWPPYRETSAAQQIFLFPP